MAIILTFFIIFDREGYLTLIASLIGATSLILNAKGNPLGQLLMVIFSLLYGAVSWGFRYYGEMLTYLGMTAPMALFAMISWLRHPFKGNRSEVAVARLSKADIALCIFLSAAVTAIFYFLLRAFDTANLLPSTLSVTTSFSAVYLTARRSPYYAIAYAANDVILIVLWVLASLADPKYISVTVCFAIFLANDIYGFASWRAIQRRQRASEIYDRLH